VGGVPESKPAPCQQVGFLLYLTEAASLSTKEEPMADNKDNLSHHGSDDALSVHHANATIRLLLERSSCRSFESRAIPADMLETILEVGTRAATGGNLQPYSIIQVREQGAKVRLAELNEDQLFIADAPVNLIFCLDWRRLRRWAALEQAPFTADRSFRHFWISFQDTIITAQNICTAADACGLGSVYVGTIIDRLEEHRELLGLPDGVFPVVLLSLGYPKFRPAVKRKLGPKWVVHEERYQDPSDDDLRLMYEEKYPGWKKEITPARLAQLAQVCRVVGGEELARSCIDQVQKTGNISAAQNYFGLHYTADSMPLGNEQFLELMRRFGFGWFEKYRPTEG
jgi:nitroreductase